MQGKKLRTTRQRQIILEELRKLKSHPTADELYEIVKKRMPHISLGTVYRNLEVLSDCGIILKLDPSYAKMRFDGNTDTHYHIICKECGRVDDLFVGPLAGVAELVRDVTDYEVSGHNLEFIGRCPACRRSEQSSVASAAQHESDG